MAVVFSSFDLIPVPICRWNVWSITEGFFADSTGVSLSISKTFQGQVSHSFLK